MQIKPIRTPADHQAALAEIETLMHAEWGSPEGDQLDVLVSLQQNCQHKEILYPNYFSQD